VFVLCPHVGDPHPDTRAVLDPYEHTVYLDLSHDPDYGYARALTQMWAAGIGFTVVEQDVVPTRRLLRELAACPEPYCAAPYAWHTTVGPALGCTKFSSLLLRTYPDAMTIAARLPSSYGDPGHYRQLDVRLMQSVLRDLYGLQPHCHAPVEHRNPKAELAAGARVTTLVEGRSYLPEGLAEQIAAGLHHS
jgi:hypothetical protein